MPIDLSSLSPEEIAELKASLENPPQDPVQVLASAMELLMAKVEGIEEKVDGVCKVVYDDFIGGIKDLASEKARSDAVGGLKEKYGGLFSPHSAYIADHIGGDADGIYPLLADHLDELKSGEGYTDEVGDAEIQKIAKEIADRVAALTGKTVVAEAKKDGEPVAPPAVSEPEGGGKSPGPKAEETKSEEKKKEPKKEEGSEEDPMKGLKEHIGKMRERGGQAA